MAEKDDSVEIYDLRGLNCPLPVLKTKRKLRAMPPHALLRVETSDPLAAIDIPHFCAENGHTLIAIEALDRGHHFLIRKAG
ncbi:sulfurtransferase TusA family protein [Phyllobacterium leguminum]|uniref:tRNA 2-thiouridine synthesizing protein A n=1 Tax=Phyllobacterium leguminum TaxID=314237 RepID=A0A318TIZ6_9HYPH|nr:sulfurtransferase TusA family protein [Phyllobacterium leguminum]PYE89044.1 tRNA 2-thiouridine synthesizing protein A [Phyllobacterium leguminum]